MISGFRLSAFPYQSPTMPPMSRLGAAYLRLSIPKASYIQNKTEIDPRRAGIRQLEPGRSPDVDRLIMIAHWAIASATGAGAQTTGSTGLLMSL